MGCMWQPFWILQEKMEISFYFWIIRVVNSHLALYSLSDVTLLTPPWHPPNDSKRLELWQVIFALNTSTRNLVDEHTLADGTPQWIEHRCLEYCYTKLGRQTYFGWWSPASTRAEMPWIPVHKTWQMNLLWPMDPLGNRAEMPWIPGHKTWQRNLHWMMDPSSTRAEMPWIPVHNTWQMNLLCPMNPQGNRAEMPSHCYWHLVVKNGNFTLLLT